MDLDDPRGEALEEDLHTRLDETSELQARTYYATAMRLAMEVRRQAKAHQLLIPFIRANFDVLNFSVNTFDLELGIESALQIIALLESPEKAAKFQPRYSDAAYQGCQWMLVPCYHMYAERTGTIHGLNSPGMQQCIADGEAVCRRTDSGYITSFREFASSVFLAADDPEMALHHARLAARTLLPNGKDRRWAGASRVVKILLDCGQISSAADACVPAVEYARTWHTPLEAMLETISLVQTTLSMLNRTDDLPRYIPDAQEWLSRTSPEGEDCDRDLHRSLARAVALSCGGDHPGAIDLLTHWDQWLTARHALSHWFGVRSRLVAAHLLAGNRQRAERLADPAIAKARTARDFHTLRRLRAMLEDARCVSPLAGTRPCDAGLFAVCPVPVAVQSPEAAAPEHPEPQAPDKAASGPLAGLIDEQAQVLATAREFPAEVLTRLMGCTPEEATHPGDVLGLLDLMCVLAHGPVPDEDVWAWAQGIASPHRKDGRVLALLAYLGAVLRGKTATLQGRIDVDELESMFRTAMDLSPDDAGVFARAGFFFLRERNPAEAERCLARSSRLDRSNDRVAIALAEVYAQTDRASDGLAVLDLCIREGAQSPDLFLLAARLGLSESQWTSALTYLDHLESVAPGERWTHYYRALAMLELGRNQDALVAAGAEAQRAGGSHFSIESVRAAALAALGRHGEAAARWDAMAAVPLRAVGDLTVSGLAGAFRRIMPFLEALPPDDPRRQQAQRRFLAAGLAPDAYFTTRRQHRPVHEDLNHYVCVLNQPLDEKWGDHEGCLPGQEHWTAYQVVYGVLASSAEEAAQAACALQRECYHIEPTVLATDLDGERFRDRPGIVWQGHHAPVEPLEGTDL